MIDYYTHWVLHCLLKKDIIINYMLILLYFFLGGLVIAAKILALVRSPGHT